MKKEIIKFNNIKSGKITYMDTGRIITKEEMEDWCDGQDYPDEGTQEWYDKVEYIKQSDLEDLGSNFSYSPIMGRQCLVHGFAGLWNGRSEGGKVMTINSLDDLLLCVRGCDDVEVYVDKDGLHVVGHHHDGTNHYMVRQLTKKGAAYWNRHCDDNNDRAVHHHMMDTKGYLTKVNYYLF